MSSFIVVGPPPGSIPRARSPITLGMRLCWARLFLALWLSLSMVFPALAQDEGGEPPVVTEDTEEVSQEPPSEEAPAEAEAMETVEPPAAVPAPAPLSDREVAAQVGPSVVQILVPSGSGSGVKIEGGVLTIPTVSCDSPRQRQQPT